MYNNLAGQAARAHEQSMRRAAARPEAMMASELRLSRRSRRSRRSSR
jgi:hypothetical protein